jgi:5-methyltetrahydropteroyltriglutamate--homocysteine methyltransferase
MVGVWRDRRGRVAPAGGRFAMKRSSDRILTTHTGSLPRPPELQEALARFDGGDGGPPDPGSVAEAVTGIVRRQAENGVDVVNDGEMGKVMYATYVVSRLSGFGGTGKALELGDARDFPGWARMTGFDDTSTFLALPACIDVVHYVDDAGVQADIANLKAAIADADVQDAFLSAASPGVISAFLDNQHYPSHEAYLRALGEAMKTEYDAIHSAGIVLQIDCPDLAMGRHIQFPDASFEEWRRTIELHVDVLNDATRDIPPQDMRLHLCWGNYEGPHHLDVPLADIIEIVLRARPAAISFEAANPRHEHEYHVFEDVKLPDGKLLLPGVLDSTTNYIEHPQLVAERITRYANLVGRENVVASTDCGFATGAAMVPIHPDVTWAKFRAMAEGAELATQELWAGSAAAV